MSHESTVPNASLLGSLGSLENPLELRRREVRVGHQARASTNEISWKLPQRSAVRRSCQTIAGYTDRPLRLSQRSVVSRWFVIPSARQSGRDRAAARASLAARGRSPRSRPGRARPIPASGSAARSRGSRDRRTAARRRRRGRSYPSFPGRSPGSRREHARRLHRPRAGSALATRRRW